MTTTTDPRPEARGEARGGGLPGAVRAEWIKVWSLRSTWWTLGICAALWLGLSTAMAALNASTAISWGPMPLTQIGEAGFTLAHYVLIVFAALLVTGEYGTQSIRTTVQAVPVRGRLLTAKLVVTAVIAAATSVMLCVLSMGAGALIMGQNASFDAADAVQTTLAIAVFTALMCLMVCGAGAALRSTAGTITLAFVVFSVLGPILATVGIALEAQWLVDTVDHLPAEAGSHLIDAEFAPYDRPVAVGILLAWAAASVAAGYAVLKSRDV
jgi:ABC-2 type transport system permease protein